MTVGDLVAAALVDLDFMLGTTGGVTFSGGEPMAQPEFVLAAARGLRDRGVHVALETSGYWPARWIPQVVEAFDLVLFDLKHVDLGACARVIGNGSARALENLRALSASDVALEVRVTVVPGFNDRDEDLAAIGEHLADLPGSPPVLVQSYHRLATGKAAMFATPYAYAGTPPPTVERLSAAHALLRNPPYPRRSFRRAIGPRGRTARRR